MKGKYFAFLALLVFVVVSGCVDSSQQVSTFTDCVVAGNPIIDSSPRQCLHEGETFVESYEEMRTDRNFPEPPEYLQSPVIPEETNTFQMGFPVVIKHGSSFGYCLGYCESEATITPEKIVFVSIDRSSRVPDKIEEFLISSEDWNALVTLFDAEQFISLGLLSGGLDEADQGAEWVEVSDGIISKKIRFDFSEDVDGIMPFLSKLREITRSYSQSEN